MSALNSYDYAVIRVVPCVERGEFINVGIILFCRTERFLAALTYVDCQRLQVLAPTFDVALILHHLESIERICAGGKDSGHIGQLSPSERFHWLVAPRSAVIQTSPVHSGLCANPEVALYHLLESMVRLPVAGGAIC